MRHPSIVLDDAALQEFNVQPLGFSDAISRALRNEDAEFANTRWSDARSATATMRTWGGVRLGNRLVDERSVDVTAMPEATFADIERIGGATGWYYGQALWQLRGWMDLLVGGVGIRRGRRDAQRLAVGDHLDCWRVEEIESGKRLRLNAEMKLPGRAWLEFEVEPLGDQGARIHQRATFDPLGLMGLAYWYAVWPLHELVFGGMLRNIGRAAEDLQRARNESKEETEERIV